MRHADLIALAHFKMRPDRYDGHCALCGRRDLWVFGGLLEVHKRLHRRRLRICGGSGQQTPRRAAAEVARWVG